MNVSFHVAISSMVIIEMGRTEFFFNQSDFRIFPSLTQLVTVMQCWARLKVWHKKYNNERWFFHGLMNIFHHVTQTRASSKYVSILLQIFESICWGQIDSTWVAWIDTKCWVSVFCFEIIFTYLSVCLLKVVIHIMLELC